jgi:hypothetical protein
VTDPTHLPPQQSAPGGHMRPLLPPPQSYPSQPSRSFKGGLIAAAIVGAAAIALTAGGIGRLIGNHILTGSAAQYSPQPVTAPPASTAEQVHAATVDLCTRFAAGYHAMPSAQNTAADVIPSLTYITQALNDDLAADGTIRNALTESLKLARDQASKLTNEPARGAIQPSTSWTAAAANAADQKVWDLCRAFGS